MKSLLPLLTVLAIAFSARLQASAAETSYEVSGVIRAEPSGGRIVIAHREIPGFMAAMTMSFVVADPKEATSLKTGDEVKFRLRKSDDDFVVDQFVVTGHATAPTPAAGKITRLKAGSALPAFSLIDEESRPVTPDTMRGHNTVVTFIFTRCPVPEFCPAMALKFAALQKAVETTPALAGTRLLSITLDPEFDRPDILAAYGKAVGAKSAIWNFATGSTEEASRLARAFSVFTERNGAILDHTLCTALIGPDGRVSELWRGNDWKIEDVVAALGDR
jgi:protein SCO1/2